MLRLAFRNIFRQQARSALTLGVIILGVAGLIVSGGFVEDIFLQLREATIHSQLGHIQVNKAGYRTVGRRNPYEFLIDDPRPVEAKLSAIPGVTQVLLRIQFTGLASTGRADLPIIGEGVEPDKEARLGTSLNIISGKQLAASDTFGILVGEGVAKALQLTPGDPVTLLASTPDGALNSWDFDVVGVFRTFSKDYDDRAVRIPLSVVEDLLLTPAIHTLVLSLQHTDLTDDVVAHVSQRLERDQFEVLPWYELADFYKQAVDLYRRQFGVLQVIILLMVLLSVVNSVNTAIYERTGEFGTLMALGRRQSEIFRLVLLENALMGALGAALGVVVGIALAWSISQVGIPMPPAPNSNSEYTAYVQFVPWVIAFGFAIGSIATLLAAVLPARRASRLPIAEALRQNV